MEKQAAGAAKPLDRYFSKTDVWAIAFGCMIGWGVFAMPGTTFLPVAGPAGTGISMLLGMAFMLVIGRNFSFLMTRFPMTGGVYTYTKEAFGRDHAFLCSWFLCLSYLTIVFLNGTALFIIVRTLLADVAQSGFHYSVAGNTIYLGETLVSVLVLAAVGDSVCVRETGASAPAHHPGPDPGLRNCRYRGFLPARRLRRRRAGFLRDPGAEPGIRGAEPGDYGALGFCRV